MHLNSFISVCFLVVCLTFIQGIACKKEKIVLNNDDRQVIARSSRRRMLKRNACSQVALENGTCGLTNSRGGAGGYTKAVSRTPASTAPVTGGLPLSLPVAGAANTGSLGLEVVPGTVNTLLSTGTGVVSKLSPAAGASNQGYPSRNIGPSSSNNISDISDDDNDEDDDDEE